MCERGWSAISILKDYRVVVESIIEQAEKFYQLGYQMSNGGNLSARVPGTDYMIVKGTDVAFSELSPETLVVTDFDGRIIEGDIKPSKESLLHGAIYRKLPHVMAIMHCHSPWATAYAAKHDELEFSTYHSKMKLKGVCPVFNTGSYVVPEHYFGQILEWFDRHPQMNSFILRGHGQVTVGRDMREAAMLAELVEETAKIALLSKL